MFDVGELESLRERAVAVRERVLVGDDVLVQIRSINEAMHLLLGAESVLLAEADATGITDIATGMRTAQWLARETGVAPSTAKRRVRLAGVLRNELPATGAAVGEGRLSADRAQVMASVINDRIAKEFREIEQSLIDESARMTFPEWSQRVRLVGALLDQDGPAPADDVDNNRLRLNGGVDGTKVAGTLVGDAAVVARSALDQVTDELWQQYTADSERTNGEITVPSRDTLRALAFAELCRRGLMVGRDGQGTKPKVEATFVIRAENTGVVYLNGKPLVKGSAEALACDMEVWTIVLDSLGIPLDMGREIRTANRHQRRALQQRDGGCVFPGCSMRPEHCDAHHVAEWHRDLGTTDVKHMVFLCRHHHGVIHRRGWSLRIGDDGSSWITMPTGVSMWCQRHGTTRAGPLPNAA